MADLNVQAGGSVAANKDGASGSADLTLGLAQDKSEIDLTVSVLSTGKAAAGVSGYFIADPLELNGYVKGVFPDQANVLWGANVGVVGNASSKLRLGAFTSLDMGASKDGVTVGTSLSMRTEVALGDSGKFFFVNNLGAAFALSPEFSTSAYDVGYLKYVF